MTLISNINTYKTQILSKFKGRHRLRYISIYMAKCRRHSRLDCGEIYFVALKLKTVW